MKFWAVLALAALVAAVPFQGVPLHKRAGERMFVGYRTLSKAEVEAIKLNGGKAVQSEGTSGRQLGPGVYISPAFMDWPDYDPDKGIPWDCAVTIDAVTWAGLNKAWIPKFYEFPEDREANPDKCKPLTLWTPRWRDNRSRFLKHLDASFTLANTIVFAVVDGHEPKTQALIAPAIIDSGYFYLQQCAERETEAHNQIGGYGTVDWGTSGMPGWNMGSDAA